MIKTAVLSSYFCLKRHPQYFGASTKGIGGLDTKRGRVGFVKKNLSSYCDSWIKSLSGYNLQSFIFHDGLSEPFVRIMSNQSDNLSFKKVRRAVYSNNDQRFFNYLEFLNEHKFDKVFLTDLWDVECKRDPSRLNIDSHDLFFCEDTMSVYDYQFSNKSFFDICKDSKLESMDIFHKNTFKLLNMGVIGGSYHNIVKFLELFTEHRAKINPLPNINMTLGNYIARVFFKDIYHGFPFCSEYKTFSDRSDVYFKHK